MKKHTLRIVLLGAALSAFAFPAFIRAADDTPAPKPAPTDNPRQRFNPADMLKNYRDQFEGLNLSDDQMKKIDGFIETAEAEVKKASDDQAGRRAAFEAIGKLREDVNSILNDTQKAQLTKKRNVEAVNRFKEPYANPELKLTDDQKTKLEAVYSDLLTQLGSVPAGANGRPDRDAMRKVYTDAREKAKAVLTEEQQKLIPARGFGRPRGGQGTTPPPPPAK